MKKISFYAMTALLTAGLSMSAFAQTTPAKTAAPATKTAAADPCQSQKDAVTKAKAAKPANAANSKTASTALKTCQTNAKKAAAAKKGGK